MTGGQPQNQSTLRYSEEGTVKVINEERMMLYLSDWSRIRKNVGSLGESLTELAMGISASLFGAALALFGVVISLDTSKDSHESFRTGLWVAIAFCGLFAFFFFLIGLRERKRYRASAGQIADDMDTVAARAGHAGLGVGPPKPGIFQRFLRSIGRGTTDQASSAGGPPGPAA